MLPEKNVYTKYDIVPSLVVVPSETDFEPSSLLTTLIGGAGSKCSSGADDELNISLLGNEYG